MTTRPCGVASTDPPASGYRGTSMAARRLTVRRTLAATTVTVVAIAGGGCSGDGNDAAERPSGVERPAAGASLTGLTFDVRKDPGCGCCTSWVEYLQERGATVNVAEDPDRDAFRADRGISDDAASCHTAIVEGYAIEGHVPAGAIRRLLADRPDAAGLALPGMPSDGPGMGGDETTWESQPVMLVANDGELTTFEY